MTQRPGEQDTNALVGPRLRALREAAGLTQAEVSTRLGLPQGSLSRYEAGRHRLPADVALALCRIYGCSLETIYAEPEPQEEGAHA